jgi:eukaryotic-like serine/threonine-protein kinase
MHEAGERIGGKYQLVRLIATGGMGTVHEARHEKTRGRVAIKILSETAKQDPASRARFAREARAAGRLRSRHVAKVLDVDALEDGTPYLVMEYLEGEDLSRVVKAKGALPIQQVASILVQVCAGVAEAHANGIIHRDLKPGNIFLAEEGALQIAKVLDFGISKVPSEADDEELTRTFSTMGTPGYMSPEQIRAPKDVDEATDVWALGVILYRLLTASLPFAGNASSIAVAICNDAPAPIEVPIPRDVKRLIAETLDKDRTRRPTVREVAEVLSGHLGIDASIASEAWAELNRIDVTKPRKRLEETTSEPTFAATERMITEPSRRALWPFAVGGVAIAAAIAYAATRQRSAPPPVVAAPPVSVEPPSPPASVAAPTATPSPSVASAPSITSKPTSPPAAKAKPSTNAAASIPARL